MCFTVKGNDIIRDLFSQTLSYFHEAFAKMCWGNCLEYPIERIMAGYTAHSYHLLEPILACLCKIFHVIKSSSATEVCTQGNEQDHFQTVDFCPFHAGVR